MQKQNKNLDEINERLNSFAQKLQQEKIELSYNQYDEWAPQEVKLVSVSLNNQILNFHLCGSCQYGSWNQMGAITISNDNQVETFSRKLYDEPDIHGGDVLIYYGTFDEQIQTFVGNWYYLEHQMSGEWYLKFKGQ
ncbi:unnamed protein product [Paramecium sonneborni]|uniref:Uncharacterized protein n=1 Tax=Paramecium sonneborni TaxID=65129 RepID=A0A8S1RQ98_9CILI|nr:unnamed protein product [Paramecium sonneborni]CAD8128774.1 unnamed protein product [Paramecium sonneborni]